MPRNNNVETIVLDRNFGILTRRIRQVAYLSDQAEVDSIMGQFQESAKQAIADASKTPIDSAYARPERKFGPGHGRGNRGD